MSGECDFPDGPITPDVVNELSPPEWRAGKCPICMAQAALNAGYVISVCCPVCQRYTVTLAAKKEIEAYRGHPLGLGLNYYCRKQRQPLSLTPQNWRGFAQAGWQASRT